MKRKNWIGVVTTSEIDLYKIGKLLLRVPLPKSMDWEMACVGGARVLGITGRIARTDFSTTNVCDLMAVVGAYRMLCDVAEELNIDVERHAEVEELKIALSLGVHYSE